MIQKQVLMAGPTLHPTIESTLCVSCTPPFDLDKCWCPGEVSAVSPWGGFLVNAEGSAQVKTEGR